MNELKKVVLYTVCFLVLLTFPIALFRGVDTTSQVNEKICAVRQEDYARTVRLLNVAAKTYDYATLAPYWRALGPRPSC